MPPVSLAQLALRTNLGKHELWERLHVRDLTESEAEAVAPELRREGATRPIHWHLVPGDRVLRRELHDAYGGSIQGGIIASSRFPDLFVFTDPERGARHGYDLYERLMPDGSYTYTGAGQEGDQTFLRGNKALLESAQRGQKIRLFRQEPRYVTYVGEFATGTPAYELRQIPDRNGNMRTGIIFKLIPVSADPTLLATADVSSAVATESAWTAPSSTDVVATGARELAAGRRISRREFELQRSFGEWLTRQGERVSVLSLPVDGTIITPDLYVSSRSWIVEAKRSVAREHVRTAIGQSLDYAHVARMHGYKAKPMILLPGAPTGSLTDLVRTNGIALAMQAGAGFSVLTPDAPLA
ncbi:hypothetical protein B5M43_004250 [Microbacterium sp. MEC084]|uniref:hypothetical protein n=1 Tax=Microbacterium sp. MEC084 TaxID=1963027 RepID=UPI00106FBB99|nr:hypothetical protein [Microbacterium sp. MEC084]MCD1268060.1 hypothetical protein [Microbacterium sp. MEC084]